MLSYVGFYYAQISSRTVLAYRWKIFGSKLDKLKGSLFPSLGRMGLSIDDRMSFLADIDMFLSSSWKQYGYNKKLGAYTDVR